MFKTIITKTQSQETDQSISVLTSDKDLIKVRRTDSRLCEELVNRLFILATELNIFNQLNDKDSNTKRFSVLRIYRTCQYQETRQFVNAQYGFIDSFPEVFIDTKVVLHAISVYTEAFRLMQQFVESQCYFKEDFVVSAEHLESIKEAIFNALISMAKFPVNRDANPREASCQIQELEQMYSEPFYELFKFYRHTDTYSLMCRPRCQMLTLYKMDKAKFIVFSDQYPHSRTCGNIQQMFYYQYQQIYYCLNDDISNLSEQQISFLVFLNDLLKDALIKEFRSVRCPLTGSGYPIPELDNYLQQKWDIDTIRHYRDMYETIIIQDLITPALQFIGHPDCQQSDKHSALQFTGDHIYQYIIRNVKLSYDKAAIVTNNILTNANYSELASSLQATIQTFV